MRCTQAVQQAWLQLSVGPGPGRGLGDGQAAADDWGDEGDDLVFGGVGERADADEGVGDGEPDQLGEGGGDIDLGDAERGGDARYQDCFGVAAQ